MVLVVFHTLREIRKNKKDIVVRGFPYAIYKLALAKFQKTTTVFGKDVVEYNQQIRFC